MIDNPDTIAAIATPSGKGGIGIVRISGSAAYAILEQVTGIRPSPSQARYCCFRDDKGEILDRGIALYFKAPASYTGEDVVELQGHGGPVILDIILNMVVKLGARLARPGEFTERAFHNDKMDLLQAEAVADLIESASAEAARSAMRSLNGQFSSLIDTLLQSLVSIRVHVEGTLDFPDEDIDFIKSLDLREKVARSLAQLRQLLQQARQGRVLKEGINTVLIGAPNVGKSSLLNALARIDRAIVTDIPGTTRDLVEEIIIIDGMPVSLVDTAGIRESGDAIEQEGIRRTWRAVKEADLVLLVVDAMAGVKEIDNVEKQIPEGKDVLVLRNKIDLTREPARIDRLPGNRQCVFVSAKTGAGLDLLCDEIKRLAGMSVPAEVVLAGRTRHIEALENAEERLSRALTKLEAETPTTELIAEDLLQSQRCLETITGRTSADDLLGEIFSRFCIGK